VAYFLAKSEPSVYSIDQLRQDRKTTWDGVTNPQAVKTIASMKRGDRVFFYHSGGVSAVVGLMEVLGEGRPDPKNPKSAVVDVGYLAHLDPPVGLKEIKESGLFADWALVRQSRLSTMPAPENFVRWMRRKFPQAGI
jgi:predicted RNA-binding protein with PUA-like domain